jgi:hypothetical protein
MAPKKTFKPKLAKTPRGAIVEELTSKSFTKASIDFVREIRHR